MGIGNTARDRRKGIIKKHWIKDSLPQILLKSVHIIEQAPIGIFSISIDLKLGKYRTKSFFLCFLGIIVLHLCLLLFVFTYSFY